MGNSGYKGRRKGKSRGRRPSLNDQKQPLASLYTMGSKIGEGGFASVHRCKCLQTNRLRACKVINKVQMKRIYRRNRDYVDRIAELMRNEIDIQRKVAHENIVMVYDGSCGGGSPWWIRACVVRGGQPPDGGKAIQCCVDLIAYSKYTEFVI